MSVATFTKTGTKATTPAKLDKAIFGVEVKNHELLKQAYVAYLANGRLNLAVTKNRGDVSGGGKKPWRQKGTGRARFGSTRNPIWRGGGVAFGPTGLENYTHKLPVAQKRLAIRQAFSLAAEDNKVIVIEDLLLKGKTADAAKLLDKIGVSRNALLIIENKTEALLHATDNLPNVIVAQAKYANVFDIMNADHIVVTQDALKSLGTWLGTATKETK
jgi:large subunit ribosomal protein L4